MRSLLCLFIVLSGCSLIIPFDPMDQPTRDAGDGDADSDVDLDADADDDRESDADDDLGADADGDIDLDADDEAVSDADVDADEEIDSDPDDDIVEDDGDIDLDADEPDDADVEAECVVDITGLRTIALDDPDTPEEEGEIREELSVGGCTPSPTPDGPQGTLYVDFMATNIGESTYRHLLLSVRGLGPRGVLLDAECGFLETPSMGAPVYLRIPDSLLTGGTFDPGETILFVIEVGIHADCSCDCTSMWLLHSVWGESVS